MVYQQGSELKRSNYRILGLVGQGQFGRVYCAAHRRTGRLVAIKNLEQRWFPTHKFLRELRFLLSLQHPNIVTFHALEHTRTGRYLVMDYCEGGTLRSLMEEDCCLSLSQSVKLVADILEGLSHAHSKGIIHCDIKPENILLSLQPTGWVARISDFGISKLAQELDNQGFGNTGSPAYMAPERFYGQYSHSADVYSVGITLYELLAGHRPFSGTPIELMSAHLNQPLRVPDTIPAVWHPILITALQKLVARRFRSAGDMLDMLKKVSAETGLQTLEGHGRAVQIPLLQPNYSVPVCEWAVEQEKPLQDQVSQVAIADRQEALLSKLEPTHPGVGLYRAEGTWVKFLPPASSEATIAPALAEAKEQLIDLKQPIRELVLRPQGCFAIAPSAVYWIHWEEERATLVAKPVATASVPCEVAIEPKGRWLAILTPGETRKLQFWSLESINHPVWLEPEPIALPQKEPTMQLVRMVALDARHLALLSQVQSRPTIHRADDLATPIYQTRLECYNRRGDRLMGLTMPLELTQVVSTPTPYRLLATDSYDPFSILLVDLKPYRVIRVGVSITPNFLVATTWGYILADREGHILLLDEEGRQINQIDAPPHLTAIASFDHHRLAIATWDGQQGTLAIADLKQLGVEMMF